MCKNTTHLLEITIIILMLTKGIHTTSSKVCISPVFKMFHWPLITFRIKFTPIHGLAGPACVGSCLPPLIPHFLFQFTPTTLASFFWLRLCTWYITCLKCSSLSSSHGWLFFISQISPQTSPPQIVRIVITL